MPAGMLCKIAAQNSQKIVKGKSVMACTDDG
ncbi:TetR/AcrR family transcriptional regulator, partial [Salmonella enterica subsp. enterica serovar Bareilly]|nr:TetR/AcrR family transcriptional regulator [Salmonella enterica subsp. enterica serovar Bareilly]